ncbi:hypothetical protein NC651_028212 [Populus alba x Populus x berolinensis]|nr:hypothetical protein NC651_028212 [Populus alba x Populus x berolinensis]
MEPVTNKTTNHGIVVNKETIKLLGAKKKRTRKAKTPADSSDRDSQRNRTSRPTPLVTPPAAEGPGDGVGTDLTLNAPKDHQFKKESDLRYRFNKEFGCDCCACFRSKSYGYNEKNEEWMKEQDSVTK